MDKDNRIYFYIVLLFVYVACLFLPWGSFMVNTGQPIQGPDGLPQYKEYLMTTNGFTGSISMSGIVMDTWVLIVISIVSTIMKILNIQKMIQIPDSIASLMDIFVLFWLVLSGYVFIATGGSISIGLILMAGGNLISMFLNTPLKIGVRPNA